MPEWTIEFYSDQNGREPCREWMEKLGRVERDAIETAIELVLAERGLDVVATEYGIALTPSRPVPGLRTRRREQDGHPRRRAPHCRSKVHPAPLRT
jgi:hypothetical protein